MHDLDQVGTGGNGYTDMRIWLGWLPRPLSCWLGTPFHHTTDDMSFEIGDQPGPLHPSDYSLPGVRDGRLLCFGPRSVPGAPPSLVVPCPEVVRVAYAPHAALARAVIDHPWSRWTRYVLDVERSGPLEDGSGWQVAPRARLRPEHLAVAANLALNPAARRRLWATSVRLHTGVQGERWLGYAIEGLRWPPPPMGPPQKLVLVPGSTVRSSRDRQPSGERRPQRRGRVIEDGDPRPSAPLAVVLKGPDWMDAPDVVKAKRPRGIVRVSGHELSSPARARVGSVGQLAAAEPGRSRDGPTPVDPQVVKPQNTASWSSPIFEEVSAMLDDPVVSGAPQAREVVAAAGADLARRGDVAAWGFPPTCRCRRRGRTSRSAAGTSASSHESGRPTDFASTYGGGIGAPPRRRPGRLLDRDRAKSLRSLPLAGLLNDGRDADRGGR